MLPLCYPPCYPYVTHHVTPVLPLCYPYVTPCVTPRVTPMLLLCDPLCYSYVTPYVTPRVTPMLLLCDPRVTNPNPNPYPYIIPTLYTMLPLYYPYNIHNLSYNMTPLTAVRKGQHMNERSERITTSFCIYLQRSLYAHALHM
jgi:hypothetical protein